MITIFKCGIYEAVFNSIGGDKWLLRVNQYVIGIVETDGNLLKFTDTPVLLSTKDFAEITVLMNNIKHQYKQLHPTKD
jgi:hypothetical protein